MRNRTHHAPRAAAANQEPAPDTTPDPADRETGYLTPANAYSLVETLRGVYLSFWGLNTNGTMQNQQTLYAMTLIEGFCAGLSAITNIAELANLLTLRCCRRDGAEVESGERPLTQQLTYIIFRFISTAFSGLGVGFLGYAIPQTQDQLVNILNNSTAVSQLLEAIANAAGLSQADKKYVTLGLISLSISAITARYLSGKKLKLTGGVIRDHGIEMALRAAPQQGPAQHEEELLPANPRGAHVQHMEVVVDPPAQPAPAPPVQRQAEAPAQPAVLAGAAAGQRQRQGNRRRKRQNQNQFFQPAPPPDAPVQPAAVQQQDGPRQ